MSWSIAMFTLATESLVSASGNASFGISSRVISGGSLRNFDTILRGVLPVVVDDVVGLGDGRHEPLGGVAVLLDPAPVHVDEVAAGEDALRVAHDLGALDAHDRSGRPRLPHREAVQVAALERGHHLRRLNVDDRVVGPVE